MTDLQTRPPEGRRRKQRWIPGTIAVLISLAILVGGAVLVLSQGVDFVKGMLASADDYPGPGTGEVFFEVQEGDTIAAMGRNLKAQGIVKSVDAFTEAAAEAESESRGIQVGFYQLRKEMKAEDALKILIDPVNLQRNAVTIPEGLRVVDIVGILVKNSEFKKSAFDKVLAQPQKLGLPKYAKGNPEGYLFPATYEFGPKATPTSMLTMMVDRWKQAATDTNLLQRAKALGYTPHELMTVASLIQAEARGKYMPMVSRVIYNRLEERGETFFKLQLDATVNYAHGKNLGATTTDEERDLDSPYNTYVTEGLPPGPIEAPGEEAMQAAGNPADGPWFYYVTVNLATGETKFAETLAEHNVNRAEFLEYCRTESERC
ncbi:MAG: endolytic transglycosylase MltG [Nocardioides sp.]